MKRKDAKLVGRCEGCAGRIIVWARGMKQLGSLENLTHVTVPCPACGNGVRMEIKRILLSKKKGEIRSESKTIKEGPWWTV